MNTKILEIGLQVQCDFRCSYCISEKADNWANLTALEVDPLIQYIRTHFDDDTLISVTGGEPMMWDGLQKLVESFPNNLFLMASNIKHIIKHEWLMNPTDELRDRLAFRIGYHPNVRDDDFLEKINLIKDAGYHYVVNYMVDGIDRAGLIHDRIKFLKDNDINYEVSAEEDDDLGYLFKDEMVSPQFHMRTFVDNKYFMRINSSGKVYDCYIGEPNGTVDDNTMDTTHKEINAYCDSCDGLCGYTKILYQWTKFDFSTILPTRDRFKSDLDYRVFNELLEFLEVIDDDDGLAKYKAYRVKF